MSTYLSLVNQINHRVNEVELTSANFASASGFYNTAKDAVNHSIRRINQDHFQWPFNHVTYEENLLIGQTRYDFQADAKHVDFDSFRIKKDETLGNQSTTLRKINYNEYLRRYVEQESFGGDPLVDSSGLPITDSSGNPILSSGGAEDTNLPQMVFRSQNLSYGLVPAPDKEYTLVYEYFKLPIDLVAHDDTPSIPAAFDHIIVDGAMRYVYDFRKDEERAARYEALFKNELDGMRTIYTNHDESLLDTRIVRSGPKYSRVHRDY